jgi:hypothetical protein
VAQVDLVVAQEAPLVEQELRSKVLRVEMILAMVMQAVAVALVQ